MGLVRLSNNSAYRISSIFWNSSSDYELFYAAPFRATSLQGVLSLQGNIIPDLYVRHDYLNIMKLEFFVKIFFFAFNFFLVSSLSDYEGEGPNVIAYIQIINNGHGKYIVSIKTRKTE